MLQVEDNQTPNLDVLVRSEKILLLFRQSFPAAFVSISISALLTAILWPVQDHKLLLGWFLLLTLSSFLRLAIFRSYRQKSLPRANILAWEKPYFFSLMLSALIWGVGAVVIMPLDSPFHQAIIFYFLIGMSGGAISVYSAHRGMVLFAVACILFPAIAWMLWQGSLATVGMGIGALIFYASLVRATKVLSSTLHENFVMNYELKKANEFAERLARMDQLTGVYNRRAFYEQVAMLENHIERHKDIVTVIIMDLDHFKRINDEYGHAAGDAVLRHTGKLLQATTRKSDICARIGGEEFGLLLLSNTSDDAMILAEKLRHEIETTPISYNSDRLSVTSSFGIASGESNIEGLVMRADAAMYRAKKAGRNQIECE
ncbi:MAG: GGDEF domain-containing protein [Gammaproteobacteria bacterium]|nr:GGDEF domain-containing protein [Gammaproteobacteria bacterium]